MASVDALRVELANNLSQTLAGNKERQAAEQKISQLKQQPGFLYASLQLVASDDGNVNANIKLASALLFKNTVKECWEPSDDSTVTISEEERNEIRTHIVGLMVQSDAKIKRVLGEAIALMAASDYPNKWPNLVKDMVARLSEKDFVTNNAILATARAIFSRWESEEKSNELFTIIKLVLEEFSGTYQQIFEYTDKLVDANNANKQDLDVLLETIHLLVQLFYSLTFQDYPPFVEDNHALFMNLMLKYLKYDNSRFYDNKDADGEKTIVDSIKTAVLRVVALFAHRYEEEFVELPKFVDEAWSLLINLSAGTRHDELVNSAISFLTSIVKTNRHKDIFAGNLQQICESVILPNMQLREAELELFEDDPTQFVSREVEGAEGDPRRKAATELVHALLKAFESQFTAGMMQYVQGLQQQYEANPTNNWIAKDTAMYLISALSTTSTATQHGVTSTNSYFNIAEYAEKHVLPLVSAPVSGAGEVHPMLRFDATRYLLLFRNQLPREIHLHVYQALLQQLLSPNQALRAYSAYAIERLLFLKVAGAAAITPADVLNSAEALFGNLFQQFGDSPGPQQLAENRLAMKAIMRSIIVCRSGLATPAQHLMSRLVQLLDIIMPNPLNASFNHYLFESIGSVIRFACPAKPELVPEFESALFARFQAIFENNVTELTSYVLQIISALAATHTGTSAGLTAPYKGLLDSLLAPQMWESPSNVPALVDLLRSYIVADPAYMGDSVTLNKILGIFQMLISKKSTDTHGFDLIVSVVTSLPEQAWSPRLRNIFVLLLTRLQTSKTPKFSRGFVHFLAIMLLHPTVPSAAEKTAAAVNEIQPGIFGQLLAGVVIPDIPNILANAHRKMVVLGYLELLKKPALIGTNNANIIWSKLLNATIALLYSMYTGKSAGVDGQDEAAEVEGIDLDENAFHAAYTRIATIGLKPVDLCPTVTNLKKHFVQELHALQSAQPALVDSALQSLDAKLVQFLSN
ncbi:Cse1-domain-containing protein [Ramicandelaber brevisporus]|nr:Cse1-domain-containing protein [Ramicandelaber brevisporus]